MQNLLNKRFKVSSFQGWSNETYVIKKISFRKIKMNKYTTVETIVHSSSGTQFRLSEIALFDKL